MSLEQLERRVGGAPEAKAVPKPKIPAPKTKRDAPVTPPIKGPVSPGPPPGPGDAAAFWDSLAGAGAGGGATRRGSAPVLPVPVPAPVSMPPVPRAAAGDDGAAALKGLLGIGGSAQPPPPRAPAAPASAPKSLAEIEALAGVAPVPDVSAGGDDDDPLAFWKSLQAQHRSEADKLTGGGADEGGGGRRRRKK